MCSSTIHVAVWGSCFRRGGVAVRSRHHHTNRRALHPAPCLHAGEPLNELRARRQYMLLNLRQVGRPAVSQFPNWPTGEMYATSATASSKPFGIFQDSGDSSKVPREATSQYTLRPRRRPRITQKSFPPASRGEARTAPFTQRRIILVPAFPLRLVIECLQAYVVQGMQKAVVAETAPTSSADSSASVAHSAGTSGECGPCRKKRSDFEEQAELVDVLNMLSQMYRDQVQRPI